MPYGRFHSQTLKDMATQLLIKYKSGGLVTQYVPLARPTSNLGGAPVLLLHSRKDIKVWQTNPFSVFVCYIGYQVLKEGQIRLSLIFMVALIQPAR